MTDIVEQLRSQFDYLNSINVGREAAELIEWLRKQVEFKNKIIEKLSREEDHLCDVLKQIRDKTDDLDLLLIIEKALE